MGSPGSNLVFDTVVRVVFLSVLWAKRQKERKEHTERASFHFLFEFHVKTIVTNQILLTVQTAGQTQHKTELLMPIRALFQISMLFEQIKQRGSFPRFLRNHKLRVYTKTHTSEEKHTSLTITGQQE